MDGLLIWNFYSQDDEDGEDQKAMDSEDAENMRKLEEESGTVFYCSLKPPISYVCSVPVSIQCIRVAKPHEFFVRLTKISSISRSP